MQGPNDPQAFKNFEHEGWETIAGAYHDHFAELTTQAVKPLLQAVGIGKGVRLLDVATGGGYAAAAASALGANVTGIDFAGPQVSFARRQHPEIRFAQGDAEALAFGDGQFDAVVMNFGLLHLARPERALSEAHRVLRPQGRYAFTVWATPDKAVGLGIALQAIQAHGSMEVPLPPGPPFFRFSDGGESERALTAAGFVDPSFVQLPLVWRLPSPDSLFIALVEGSVRTRGLLRAQSPAALQKIRAAIHDAAAAYVTAGLTEIPMPCVLAAATRS